MRRRLLLGRAGPVLVLHDGSRRGTVLRILAAAPALEADAMSDYVECALCHRPVEMDEARFSEKDGGYAHPRCLDRRQEVLA